VTGSTRERRSRRRFIAGAAAAGLAAASAGCIRRARSVISRSEPDRVSVSLTCVPAEEDPFPIELLDHFRNNLEAVGIATSAAYRSFEEFRFDVLLNHDFDIAIGRLPGHADPDVLYGLLHSSFVPERGWQNPYGFSSADLDDRLEEQRTVDDRGESVSALLQSVAREQPVSPIAFPIENRLVRADRYGGFDGRRFNQPTDVLALDPEERREELAFTIGFTAPTKNLNPLSVEHRTKNVVTGLLYDSLVIFDEHGDEEDDAGGHSAGEYRPWLAREVSWEDGQAVVTLRDVTWHDGEAVTSEDVAFTYRLVEDSTLGDSESPAPAPMFRGRTSMIEAIDVLDDRTLAFELAAGEAVAPRALTVPILPEHEWADRTGTADVSGIESDEHTTEAFVTPNVPPVGSGPYRFVDRTERDYVELELVEEHFVRSAEELSTYRPPAERVRVVVAPSEEDAREGILAGEFDLTLSPIPAGVLEFGDDGETEVITGAALDVYHVGYNARRDPMSNAAFRRLLGGLLDKAWLATEVFEGEAEPTSTVVGTDEWLPDELRWDGTDSETPFFGTDGELDVDAAKEAFVDAGFRYDDGELLGTREA